MVFEEVVVSSSSSSCVGASASAGAGAGASASARLPTEATSDVRTLLVIDTI